MSHRTPLLINPKAGSLFRSGLMSWLRAHRGEFREVHTKSAEDLTQKARELAESGEPVVAAAGGDGTLMSAAEGLIGTDAALGILPCGTMNVFARELGIGSRRFDAALEAIQGDKRQAVDIFAVNGKPFLQVAGFGPDARAIELITPELKKRMGAAAHVITGLKAAMETPPLITLTLPDGTNLHGTQIIMGNGKRYGGAAHLFAKASLNDGHLDVAVINQANLGVLFEVLGLIVSQGATQQNISDFTQLCQIDKCEIKAEGRLAYHLDGDFAGTLHPGEVLRVERLPQKLQVCVPQSESPLHPFEQIMAHPVIVDMKEKIQSLNEF